MKRVKEQVEYFDNNGTVVKKARAKYLGECPNMNVWDKAMQGLWKKIEMTSLSRMNVPEKIVDEPGKMVVEIKMALAFEYNQRITYTLVD